MQIVTTFDDNFIELAQSYFNSLRYYNKNIKCTAILNNTSKKSINYCQNNKIDHVVLNSPYNDSKSTSRWLKMNSANHVEPDDELLYTDIDIIFQNDIEKITHLNPKFMWALSLREGHTTSLRTWKKHYFSKNNTQYVINCLQKLCPELDPNIILDMPIRNCGVLYGNQHLLKLLLDRTRTIYEKMLSINKTEKAFSQSDQLCFTIAFHQEFTENTIKELPVQFNRMPFHQSYDFKDESSFLVPDTVILHLNRSKQQARPLISSWSKNIKPVVIPKPNTRCGIVLPIMTSGIAERALVKNLYSLAISNKANIYRDEDIGFPLKKRIKEIFMIRESIKDERPSLDENCFFLFNDKLFMIDHGEKTGSRAGWKIGKYVDSSKISGIFLEQMDENLDISSSQVPIFPLAYGIKQPEIWLKQGIYHDISLHQEKKYSVYFVGNRGTNISRKQQFNLVSTIPGSKVEARNNNQRMNFDDYMRDMARARIVWCPPGGRPKTHREVEAMCCEVAIMMPKQNIVEIEELIPEKHYICISEDYSNVLEKVNFYLDNEEIIAEIARNGRLWYERNSSDSARALRLYSSCQKTTTT